jgi:Flp pilus assembly protein protease CpaA
MNVPIQHLIPLGLGLLAAIGEDLRRRRVPNLVSGWVFFSGLVVRQIDQGWLAMLSGAGAAVLVIAALYRPWRLGGVGGGDVKLAAAVGAWAAWAELPRFALATALSGGVVAAICYLVARSPARKEIRANLTLAVFHNELPAVASHRAGHVSVPYAIAIACGAAVALLPDALAALSN